MNLVIRYKHSSFLKTFKTNFCKDVKGSKTAKSEINKIIKSEKIKSEYKIIEKK